MKMFLLPIVVIMVSQLIFSCSQKSTSVTRAPNSTSEADEESPWTTWSNKKTETAGLIVLSRIRNDLIKVGLHDPHIDYSSHKEVDCSKINTKFRTADGTCNDLKNPHAGAAGVAFGRNIAPEFIDHDAHENLMNPNPKLISKEFFTRDEFKPVPFLNMLAASWIQFMNHDWLTHGKNAEKNPHRIDNGEGQDIEVERTQSNPMDHSQYKKSFGKVTLNEVTHWWDGSQIYGSNQDEQNAVRSFSQGKMSTVVSNGKELLPKDSDLNTVHNKQNRGHEVTGFRDNWWVGLSMLHTLFVKEHNSIAEMLYKKHVTFDAKSKKYIWDQTGRRDRIYNSVTRNNKNIFSFTAKELDEHIFQTARLINSAVMAKIHTVEWTPAILKNKILKRGMYTNWYGIINPKTWAKGMGPDKTDWFNYINLGYVLGGIVGDKTKNYGVPYSITEEFTSVYRLHSLLPENLEFKKLSNKKKVNAVPLENTRNEKSYPIMESYDLKDLFYSFGTQLPGQLVLNNFPKFMQELKIPGHGQMDLAMVDVFRDRERGVPRYNQFRRAIGLIPIKRYSDFFPANTHLDERQQAILGKFRQIYGVDEDGNDNVELIDLLVGTSAEEVRPENFGFGETQFQIFILMASRRLMADRFFTVDYRKDNYTKAGLDWVDSEGSMHKVILRHMPELAPHLKGIDTAFYPWNN